MVFEMVIVVLKNDWLNVDSNNFTCFNVDGNAKGMAAAVMIVTAALVYNGTNSNADVECYNNVRGTND